MNAVIYFFWIIKEIFAAGTSAVIAAFKPDPGMRPIVIHYPIRLTSEWEKFWFSTSITATPGTLSIGFREDGDILLVQAVFGNDPIGIIEDLADMEEHLKPSLKNNPVDAESVQWEEYP